MVQFSIHGSPTKIIARRTSIQILNYLGIIGGFNGSVIMLFKFFGTYFSAQFLKGSIAEKLYIRKRTKGEYLQKVKETKKRLKGKADPQATFKHMFAKFNFSSFLLVMDPILQWLFYPVAFCKFCPCNRRIRLLAKVQKRFSKELDLVAIINKIRDSN